MGTRAGRPRHSGPIGPREAVPAAAESRRARFGAQDRLGGPVDDATTQPVISGVPHRTERAPLSVAGARRSAAQGGPNAGVPTTVLQRGMPRPPTGFANALL